MRALMRGMSTLVALRLLTSVAELPAQEWNLSAHAGRIRSSLDPVADVRPSFAVGVRYDDPGAGLRLSAGVPTNSVDALWGGIGGWKRLSAHRSGFLAGMDLSGNAFLTDDRRDQAAVPLPGPFDPPATPIADRSGRAVAGQALPVLGYEASRFQLHARAGISHYVSRFGGQQGDRSIRLADVQLTLTPASAFAIVPAMRRFEADGEEPSTYAGVSVMTASTLGSAWGSLGQWSGDRGEGIPWSAGARLRLHDALSLDAGARHDAFDPLYLQPAQTSWSVGVSVLVGRRASVVAPPVPSAYENGRAAIKLPVSASRTQPSIAGDFNDWKPVPMQRETNHWVYSVAVKPGVYRYAFVSPDGEWFVPKSVAGRRDDGMGGHVAVLVVR